MYFTQPVDGSIDRAGMDGSHPSSIVTGLSRPQGITIDFQNSRLYWTCEQEGTAVQSSTLEGSEVKTIVQRPISTWTSRTSGLFGRRVYWTNLRTRTLESSTLAGKDLRLMHTSPVGLWTLAVAGRVDLPNNRANDCVGQACAKVCVLSPRSFSSLY